MSTKVKTFNQFINEASVQPMSGRKVDVYSPKIMKCVATGEPFFDNEGEYTKEGDMILPIRDNLNRDTFAVHVDGKGWEFVEGRSNESTRLTENESLPGGDVSDFLNALREFEQAALEMGRIQSKRKPFSAELIKLYSTEQGKLENARAELYKITGVSKKK